MASPGASVIPRPARVMMNSAWPKSIASGQLSLNCGNAHKTGLRCANSGGDFGYIAGQAQILHFGLYVHTFSNNSISDRETVARKTA
jgi:hypothetical protein